MHSLEYISGTGNERVQLDAGDVFSGPALDLRGRKWGHTLNYRGISGASRPAREVEIDVWILDLKEADRMRRVFDRDVANNTPGTLKAEGSWEQRALIVESDAVGNSREHVRQKLTVCLLDGTWRKQTVVRFVSDEEEQSDYAYLDYTYDYAYDYGYGDVQKRVVASEYARSPLKLVIYGPVTNPVVTIGGNQYRVNSSAPAGGYILVDGISKTIASVTLNGTITNIFEAGVRGTGEGGGTYIFEKLLPGENLVSWNRTFSFDLYYYDEEGEPPWAYQTASASL